MKWNIDKEIKNLEKDFKISFLETSFNKISPDVDRPEIYNLKFKKGEVLPTWIWTLWMFCEERGIMEPEVRIRAFGRTIHEAVLKARVELTLLVGKPRKALKLKKRDWGKSKKKESAGKSPDQ